MTKRGQVFLIAAIIISVILLSLGTVYISTRATKSTDTTLYDLSKELKGESNQVIDSGTFNGKTIAEINEFLYALSGNYSQANPDTNIVIVYGDATNAYIFNHEVVQTGGIGLSAGGNPAEIPQTLLTHTSTSRSHTGEVHVTLEDLSYDFSLTQSGDNFFVVLEREIGGERVVATG